MRKGWNPLGLGLGVHRALQRGCPGQVDGMRRQLRSSLGLQLELSGQLFQLVQLWECRGGVARWDQGLIFVLGAPLLPLQTSQRWVMGEGTRGGLCNLGCRVSTVPSTPTSPPASSPPPSDLGETKSLISLQERTILICTRKLCNFRIRCNLFNNNSD